MDQRSVPQVSVSKAANQRVFTFRTMNAHSSPATINTNAKLRNEPNASNF